MSKKKKKNIIIGLLCGFLLLMISGYAAFNSVLKIKGTSNITSNWNIKITDIKTTDLKSINGDILTNNMAFDIERPTFDNENGLIATFTTGLKSPGDTKIYEVEISNLGTLNANVIPTITNEKNSNSIEITYEGVSDTSTLTNTGNYTNTSLDTNDSFILNSGDDNKKYVYIKIKYKDSIKEQPKDEDLTAKIKLTLTASQEISNSNNPEIVSKSANIGGLEIPVVTEGDGLYIDSYNNMQKTRTNSNTENYIYRGTNPDNYIQFNGGIYRIVSVEKDGAIKIVRNLPISSLEFLENGDNFEFKQSLIEYYNQLSNSAKSQIILHSWDIGTLSEQTNFNVSVSTPSDSDMINSIIKDESQKTINSKIGLLSASDYLKANIGDYTCEKIQNSETDEYLGMDFRDVCPMVDYLFIPNKRWMVVTNYNEYSLNFSYHIGETGYITEDASGPMEVGVRPAFYLSSNTELKGTGKLNDPFRIIGDAPGTDDGTTCENLCYNIVKPE